MYKSMPSAISLQLDVTNYYQICVLVEVFVALCLSFPVATVSTVPVLRWLRMPLDPCQCALHCQKGPPQMYAPIATTTHSAGKMK